MADKLNPRAPATKPGTPVPNPIEFTGTEIDDRVRKDSGEPTDEKAVTSEQLQKIQEKAKDHTKDEPGS